MGYTAAPLEKLIEQFSQFPGIGRKGATRMAYQVLSMSDDEAAALAGAIQAAHTRLHRCRVCQNYTEAELCPICADSRRDSSLVCVVENIRDVMAIENTMQYHGLYHVLGGILSPMDGIGPADIEIDSLVSRVAEGGVTEVILALSPTMEGDTTNFYISRRLRGYDVRLSVIARGIAVGNELEYADEVTLGRSILKRTPFEI